MTRIRNWIHKLFPVAVLIVLALGDGRVELSASNPGKSPPPYLSPEESQRHFHLPEGYRLELVLSEPTISNPVLTVFDGNGRMYVAEMRTYMEDLDATGEKARLSRVSMHWSSTHEGVYDRHSVFIDGLLLPRMLLPLRDSLLVQETDSGEIYEYRDTNGDGVADQKTLFFSGKAFLANMEHQPSGLIWCMDNWIYSAVNSTRIRWTPQGVIKETTPSNGGQWGLTQDDDGKPWFINGGSEIGPLNFQQPIIYGAFRMKDESPPGFKEVFPLVAIPDVQGGAIRFRPQEKTLNHFTATCGNDIFRGDRLPKDLRGDLLFCEPVGRLVRRAKITSDDGITRLSNAYPGSEFIRSTDPYFRPVNLATSPDGTLYLTDMYRGVIQQAQWIKPGSYLRGVVEGIGLQQHFGRGRIWRLVHDGFNPGPLPRMIEENVDQLVRYLEHPNGWWRDTAQRHLVLRQDMSALPALRSLARSHASAVTRMHALWTLEGLNALDMSLVQETLNDADPRVRIAAMRAGESILPRGHALFHGEIKTRLRSPEPEIAIQAMLTLHRMKGDDAKRVIQEVGHTHPSRGVKEIAAQLTTPLSSQLSLQSSGPQKERLIEGQSIYLNLCFACHGFDGKGTPIPGSQATLAPALSNSPIVLGHADGTIRALLHGIARPGGGEAGDGIMPPMGANDDAWIAAIVSYIRTGFGNTASMVTPEDVTKVRAEQAQRTEPWSREELLLRTPQELRNQTAWIGTSNYLDPETQAGLPVALPPSKVFSTDTPQTPGTWLAVELPELVNLCAVRFASLKSPRNYPRDYRVEVSADGTVWNSVAEGIGFGEGPIFEKNFSPTLVRRIRIVLAQPANLPWSIDDLKLFVAP